MSPDLWKELNTALQYQLKPNGYSGHLLSHFDAKKTHLEDIIKRTALMSESNSVLIIGSSGSGKAALLECVVEKVFQDRAVCDNMLQVSLDGMIHIDGNTALQDITRQLKLQEVEDAPLRSFSEKLRLLLDTLKSGTKKSKSVLFILNQFDLFCKHKNQNLLYNLFDIVQSQQTPICVVGVCCQPDILQKLENRVNSRFSHQKILLCESITLEDYIESAKHFVSLHNFEDAKFLKRWNSEIACLFIESEVKDILEWLLNRQRTLRALKNLLTYAVLNMKRSQPKLTVEDIQTAYKKYFPDYKSELILGLSVLDVSLVVAMTHITEIYDGEPFNFEIVFSELDKFLRNRMKWTIEKAVVRKSFERLLRIELVKSCGDSTSCELRNYMPVRLMIRPYEIKKILGKYQNLPGELKNWIESSLNP
uniref:Origin recognition complex subunit 4 n=1 Tax=Parasteatoda tepidariorum TaxID=114398 RepID=A0A2L2YJI2_PARTP